MGVQIGARYYPQDRRSKMSTDEVRESDQGGVHVTEVYAFPEETPGSTRADVHFLKIGPTEGIPSKEVVIDMVRSAMDEGVFCNMTAKELSDGPSYIALGGWLGSQDLALLFIGLVELVGIERAIGEMAGQMAGQGWVLLGPSTVWAE